MNKSFAFTIEIDLFISVFKMENKNYKHKIETLNFVELNYVFFYVDLFQLRASKIISLSIHIEDRDYTNCIEKKNRLSST